MFVFRKTWRALISWKTHFEIRHFALLPTCWGINLICEILHFSCVMWNYIKYQFKGSQNMRRCFYSLNIIQKSCFYFIWACFEQIFVYYHDNHQIITTFNLLMYMRILHFIPRVILNANVVISIFFFLMLLHTGFWVLFTKSCFSVLDCTFLMSWCLVECASNNLGRTLIYGVLKFLQLLLRSSLLIANFSSFKNVN